MPRHTGHRRGSSAFLAMRHCATKEAQHHDDEQTRASSSMATGPRNLAVRAVAVFSEEVAVRFGMQGQFDDMQRKCRALLAVSRHGHCLNSLLHRVSAGTLPIDVMGVVSNHQDMRSLTEWHGVPYHYLPVIDGRKAEQEERIKDVFACSVAELLVPARLHANPERRCLPVLRRQGDRHPPLVPTGLQGRAGVLPGPRAR